MKRPIGITVLAIIFAAAGISYMMLGFQMTTAVTFGPLPSRSGHLDLGLAHRADRVWPSGPAASPPGGSSRGAGCSAISWRSSGSSRRSSPCLGTGNLSYALATTVFPFILLWYLNRASVKKAFGIVEE